MYLKNLMPGELPPDGAGLLRPEIKRQELLLLVSLSQRRLLLLRDHSQNLSDPKPHNFDLGEFVRSTAGDLGNAEEGELRLEILELAQELGLGLPSLSSLRLPSFLRSIEREGRTKSSRSASNGEDQWGLFW